MLMSKCHSCKIILGRCKSVNDMCISANNILRKYSRVQSLAGMDGTEKMQLPTLLLTSLSVQRDRREAQ